jgi:hypothetical protein
MDSRGIGFLVIASGIVLVLIGGLVISGALDWFGRLPGDIRIERGTTRVYMPLVSMLLVSVLISLLLGLLRRFL